MKSSKSFKLFLALCLFCLFITPQSVFSAEMKFATVSLQQVIAKSKAGMTAQQELESKVQEFQDKFSKEQTDLETLGADIEKKRSVWSQDVLESKERDYQMKMREFKLKTDDAQFELKQLEKKVMEPILKNLHDVISDYGKKENISMIFENTRKGLQSRTGILYAADALDVSDEILKMLDAK